MKKLLYFIVLSFTFLQVSAETTEEAINTINRSAAQIKTMKCDFVQTKHMKMLGSKMVSKGKMYCTQPSSLRWEYISPYKYTFIFRGNTVIVRKGKNQSSIDVNQNKMFKEISNIMMSSVLGKCLSDKKRFKVSLQIKGNEYIVTLIPKKKEMRQMFSKIILHYNKRLAVVDNVEMFEHNGDHTDISLINISKNTPISSTVYNAN